MTPKEEQRAVAVWKSLGRAWMSDREIAIVAAAIGEAVAEEREAIAVDLDSLGYYPMAKRVRLRGSAPNAPERIGK